MMMLSRDSFVGIIIVQLFIIYVICTLQNKAFFDIVENLGIFIFYY